MHPEMLGQYTDLYSSVFVLKYMMVLANMYLQIYYMIFKDIFNEQLAPFHIKEQLILHLLIKILSMIDKKSKMLSV